MSLPAATLAPLSRFQTVVYPPTTIGTGTVSNGLPFPLELEHRPHPLAVQDVLFPSL